jgi:hypothetical protein
MLKYSTSVLETVNSCQKCLFIIGSSFDSDSSSSGTKDNKERVECDSSPETPELNNSLETETGYTRKNKESKVKKCLTVSFLFVSVHRNKAWAGIFVEQSSLLFRLIWRVSMRLSILHIDTSFYPFIFSTLHCFPFSINEVWRSFSHFQTCLLVYISGLSILDFRWRLNK